MIKSGEYMTEEEAAVITRAMVRECIIIKKSLIRLAKFLGCTTRTINKWNLGTFPNSRALKKMHELLAEHGKEHLCFNVEISIHYLYADEIKNFVYDEFDTLS